MGVINTLIALTIFVAILSIAILISTTVSRTPAPNTHEAHGVVPQEDGRNR